MPREFFGLWEEPLDSSDKPLVGKRIVVTRAPEQAAEFIAELEARGAKVLLLPMVAHVDPEDWGAFDDTLRRLEQFDVMLFMSRNAVEFTDKRARMLGLSQKVRTFPGTMVAVVGGATAREAKRLGIRIDHVASSPTGESLVNDLRSSLQGRKVFLPRSSRGDDRLPDALREVGAEVTEVIAYRTGLPEIPDRRLLSAIRRADVDVITFASPSAFENLCDYIEASEIARLSSSIPIAAIGPITANAIRRSGVEVRIESATPVAQGFAEAIVKYYEGSSVSSNDASGVK